MPKDWKGWSVDEDLTLISRRRTGYSCREVGEELGRSLDSIRHRACRLNAGVATHKRCWSKVELRRMRSLYPRASWRDLDIAFPGWTRNAVREKARLIGVHRDRSAAADEEIRKALNLSETEAAYIAGLFDGEGTVVMVKGFPVLSLGSTCHDAIQFLHDKLGGRSYLYPNGTGLGHKPFWSWKLSKRYAVREALRRLAPYLIIKRGPW
jgi:hypothetical protein